MPPGLYGLLVVGGCCGYLVMGVADRKWGGLTLKVVATTAVVQFAVAIASPPRGSSDLWWYDMYGRILAVHHASPYTHVAADFPHDPIMKLLGPTWLHTPSVYGPLFTGISGAASLVVGTSLLSTRLVYQGLALVAVSGAAVIIGRRTRSPGAVAFLTASPVVAIYVVNGGRNDILVGLALLAATVLALDGRDTAAGVAAGLGAMVKFDGAGRRRRVGRVARRPSREELGSARRIRRSRVSWSWAISSWAPRRCSRRCAPPARCSRADRSGNG